MEKRGFFGFMGFPGKVFGKLFIDIVIKISQFLIIIVLVVHFPLMSSGADSEGGSKEVEILKKENEELRNKTRLLQEFLDKMEKQRELQQVRLPLGRYRLPEKITLAGETVPLDKWDVKERLELEFLLMLNDEAQILLYLKRSTRYFPVIEEILKANNMPEDLKYVAIVESALKPTITSMAGAVGPWQFIAATGKRHNLEKYSWLDERRNVVKSSQAAVRYLSALYKMFGSWPLALAGYNAGEERVLREMKSQGVDSYFQLALPAETERYYFKIVSAKIILSNPERYGFYLTEHDYYQPFETQVVKIELKEGKTSLRSIAEAHGTFFRQLKIFNPELTDDFLPPGVYELQVPRKGGKIIHEVKRGDNLSKIADQYNVSVGSIKQWNKISEDKYIYPGQKLTIMRE